MIHQKGLLKEIILFTRYPEPGTTKTRLIPELGANGAASLQRIMTEKLVGNVIKLKGDNHLHFAVYFTNGSQIKMQQWLGDNLAFYKQKGDDLGEKMMHAFAESRQRGARRTVIIGSDCPELDGELIGNAFEALKNNQLVLGPAIDGGYYLIGANSDISENALSLLLSEMSWGSTRVLQTTIARAENAGVSISLLKELNDIDLPSDLTYFSHHPDS